MNNVVVYTYISRMYIVFLTGLHIRAKYNYTSEECSTEIEQVGDYYNISHPHPECAVKEQERLGLGGCRRQRPHCD